MRQWVNRDGLLPCLRASRAARELKRGSAGSRLCCVVAVTMVRAGACFLRRFLPRNSKGCVPVIYCCWNSPGTVEHAMLSTQLSVYNSYAVSVLKQEFLPQLCGYLNDIYPLYPAAGCRVLCPPEQTGVRVWGDRYT